MTGVAHCHPGFSARLCGHHPHPHLSNILFLLVQREEKQLEASLDALLSQVADLKNSLGSFIYKLENEYDRLTW